MATTRIYSPFLTSEVKCGAAALDIADRQNTQSMSVALRALVILFRFVKREKELHREIPTFSISHEHRSVKLYGHYSVIEEDKTTFTAQDGKEKWTSLKFVKDVYDHTPRINELICSVIDNFIYLLPANISLDLSQAVSLSQSMPQSSHQSHAKCVLGEEDSQSSLVQVINHFSQHAVILECHGDVGNAEARILWINAYLNIMLGLWTVYRKRLAMNLIDPINQVSRPFCNCEIALEDMIKLASISSEFCHDRRPKSYGVGGTFHRDTVVLNEV